jgi:hypothetical protein
MTRHERRFRRLHDASVERRAAKHLNGGAARVDVHKVLTTYDPERMAKLHIKLLECGLVTPSLSPNIPDCAESHARDWCDVCRHWQEDAFTFFWLWKQHDDEHPDSAGKADWQRQAMEDHPDGIPSEVIDYAFECYYADKARRRADRDALLKRDGGGDGRT